MFRKSIFLLIGLLLASCASSAPETAAEPAQPDETEPPAAVPSPTILPSVEPQEVGGLTDIIWYTESHRDPQGNQMPFLPGSLITAEFSLDGTLSGTSGCNRYTGPYEVMDDQLKIGALASTMMACPEPAGVMEQETAYLQVLSNSTSFQLADGKLELLDDAGQVTLVFSDTAPATVQLPASTNDTPASISQEGLENAVYRLDSTASGTVQLTDGVYVEPAAPGSETQIKVELSEWVSYGLLPDGQTAAAVILVSSGGGSGTFYHLALMADASGQAVNLATTFLGDRVIIHALNFDESNIVVELTRQGPEDAMCCPTQRMLEVYAYQEGELVKVSSVELAGDSLTGVVWQWAEFQSSDDTVVRPENPEAYTLEFLPDGKLAAQVDCNRAMGTYSVDGSRITLEILGMTKVACPPGSLSDRYIEYLNGVVSYVFQDGNLYLALKFDSGILKFTP